MNDARDYQSIVHSLTFSLRSAEAMPVPSLLAGIGIASEIRASGSIVTPDEYLMGENHD